MAKNMSLCSSSACHYSPLASLITTTYNGGFWLGKAEPYLSLPLGFSLYFFLSLGFKW
jgi:hypothetical protein